VITENTIPVLDHGFVRLDDSMASDLSVVNGARVSFARHKTEMDESDEGLIRFLMRDRHGTPFEHNAFRFHVRAPLFVARGFRTSLLASDGFSKLLAAGLTFGFALQTFIIVGGILRLIPLTGITLPFVSYGGSSVVANFILLALLLLVSNRANAHPRERA